MRKFSSAGPPALFASGKQTTQIADLSGHSGLGTFGPTMNMLDFQNSGLTVDDALAADGAII